MDAVPFRDGSANTRSGGCTTTATPCRGLDPNHTTDVSSRKGTGAFLDDGHVRAQAGQAAQLGIERTAAAVPSDEVNLEPPCCCPAKRPPTPRAQPPRWRQRRSSSSASSP